MLPNCLTNDKCKVHIKHKLLKLRMMGKYIKYMAFLVGHLLLLFKPIFQHGPKLENSLHYTILIRFTFS